jgi:hypothetical protein
MTALERAIAGPYSAVGWLDEVGTGLDGVGASLHAHIDEVEGPYGLLAEILEAAPRLAVDTDALRAEHDSLLNAWKKAQLSLETASRVGETDNHALIRRQITTLLGRLTRHRQRGSDLVYEAYNVDISAGD